MKIITVVGARPQLVKAAAVSRELRKVYKEVLIHTGQHYDDSMSDVFFRELNIPEPDYNLGIGSGSHGAQTGAMLSALEPVLLREKPDCVLVYGDTNSTLAGALAATKLHIPIAHVEAGLRSFNRKMPEEVNRVIVDHISDLLLCPCRGAKANLTKEGIVNGVHVVGDVMFDALLFSAEKSSRSSRILKCLDLKPGKFILVTLHRAENTDIRGRLESVMLALNKLAADEPVIFPVHPRTKNKIDAMGFRFEAKNMRLIPPVGPLDMVMLERSARVILTDSGGIQKEAYWLKVPCVTLRDETEWGETISTGWNVLASANTENIVRHSRAARHPKSSPKLYGNGMAARKITEKLSAVLR